MKTIEQLLMTELKFTFEQSSRIEALIKAKQKTGWKVLQKAINKY